MTNKRWIFKTLFPSIYFIWESAYYLMAFKYILLNERNRIDGVMVSVLSLGAVDCGF